jgi:hypothetical protein
MGLQKPPIPEPLQLFYQLRRWNTLYWPGGYANQPYLLMLEFEACLEGEGALNERRKQNAEAQAEYLLKQLGKSS